VDSVDLWTVGLTVVLAIGLVAVIFGALHDRARNRRAVAEILSPPDRTIPRFAPDAPAPHYLSELQARRTPRATSTALTPKQRDEISRQFSEPRTLSVDAGYASGDFVTDEGSGWAVLDHARVLVCADPIQSTRELLAVLEPFALSQTPLVVVAPGLAQEVKATLEVNTIQSTMRLLAVLAESSQRQVVADATGAHLITRADLQAGYVPLDCLGDCDRWVSDATRSYLIQAKPAPTSPATTAGRNGDAPTTVGTGS
jgi:hypothetical protein